MRTINVSNYNNNGCLFALVLGINIASQTEEDIPTIPKLISKVTEDDVSGTNIERMQQIGDQLRATLQIALADDKILKNYFFDLFLAYCIDETRSADLDKFIEANNEFLNTMNENFGQIRISDALPNLTPHTIDKVKADQFFSGLDEILAIKPFVETEQILWFKKFHYENRIPLIEFCKLVSCYWKTLLARNDQSLAECKKAAKKWFYEVAKDIFDSEVKHKSSDAVYQELVDSYQFLLGSIDKNALRAVFYAIMVQKNWDQIYSQYVSSFCGNTAITILELSSLSVKWGVELQLRYNDGNFYTKRKMSKPALKVYLENVNPDTWVLITNPYDDDKEEEYVDAVNNKAGLLIIGDMMNSIITNQKAEFNSAKKRKDLRKLADGGSKVLTFPKQLLEPMPVDGTAMIVVGATVWSIGGIFSGVFSLARILSLEVLIPAIVAEVAMQYLKWNAYAFEGEIWKAYEIYSNEETNNCLESLQKCFTKLQNLQPTFFTNYEGYAFHDFLKGAIGQKLQHESAFNDLEKSLKATKDKRIIGAVLLLQIKMLYDKSLKSLILNKQTIKGEERNNLLKTKLETFNTSCASEIQNYLKQVLYAYFKTLEKLEKVRSFSEYSDLIKEHLENNETNILNFIKPHGSLFNIVLKFLSASSYGLMVKKFPTSQSSDIQGKKFFIKKLVECCTLIRSLQLDQAKGNYQTSIIVQEIHSYSYLMLKENVKILDDACIKMLDEFEQLRVPNSELTRYEIFHKVETYNRENQYGHKYKSLTLKDLLLEISINPHLAESKFEGKHTWLHYLPRIIVSSDERQLLQKTVQKVLLQLSPEQKTIAGYTAHMCIPANDRNGIAPIYSSIKAQNGFVGVGHKLFGVQEQIKQIHNFFEGISNRNNRFLLLSGPSGLGKKTLVEDFAAVYNYQIETFAESDPNDQYIHAKMARVDEFFARNIATNKQQILLLNDIDVICPSWIASGASDRPLDQSNAEVISAITRNIARLARSKCIVIGITRSLKNLSPKVKAIASSTISFDLPNAEVRHEIIMQCISGFRKEERGMTKKLVETTANWPPKSIMSFLHATIAKLNETDSGIISKEALLREFNATRSVLQSQYQIFDLELPELKFNCASNIPSLDLVSLSSNVERELKNINAFLETPMKFTQDENVSLNLLLSGPPGTGKTAFARAVAHKSNAALVKISGNSLGRGDAGIQKLRDIFAHLNTFEKAVLFIDEMDAIAREQYDITRTLQIELDGFVALKTKALVVIAATNVIQDIAGAVLDRFIVIRVNLPNAEQRAALFKHIVNRTKNLDGLVRLGSDSTYRQLADITEGLSQRQIVKIMQRAVFNARRLHDERLSGNPVLNIEQIIEEIVIVLDGQNPRNEYMLKKARNMLSGLQEAQEEHILLYASNAVTFNSSISLTAKTNSIRPLRDDLSDIDTDEEDDNELVYTESGDSEGAGYIVLNKNAPKPRAM